MKHHLVGILGLSLYSIAFTSVATTTTVFEDFSDTLSLEKFFRTERNISLDTTNKNLKVYLKAKAFTHHSKSHYMVFIDNTLNTIEADITITSANLGNVKSQQALMRVAGTFYNAQSTAATNSIGDVFANIAIGDRGNGLEAWYEIAESTNEDFTTENLQQGTLGTVTLGGTYHVSISYDGSNNFTFIFDNGTAVNVTAPVRVSVAYMPFRGIGARLRFGEDNSTQDTLDDELIDDGTTASINGSFDNISTTAGLVDDFTAANIDTSIWSNEQRSAEVTPEGKLKLIAIGQGSTQTSRIYIREQNFKSFGSKVTLLSNTTNNATIRPRARIVHVLGNDTYDIENGATPDGYTGNIWTQFTIERKNGALRAIVYATRVKDTNWTIQDDLFFIPLSLSSPIVENQEYDLLIDVTGTLVEYKLDGVLVHSFDMATDHNTILSGNVYPYSKGNSGIDARIQDDAGEVHVLIDEIRTSITPISVVLSSQNSNNTSVALPTTNNIFVNEAETITLSANANGGISNVYLWEQTSGNAVEVLTTTPRPNLANRTVLGNGSTFSFKIPVGSNNSDLGFSVSVVDTLSGIETKKVFVLKVDNAQSSTIAALEPTTPTPTPNTSDDSSGGGFFNLYLFSSMIMLYLVSASKRKRT